MLSMKRSHAPSVVDAKRLKDEAESAAAAAAAAAAEPDAPVGRTLRHREDRPDAAKPSGPTRDYIDITGKKAKKRGRSKEDEELEPILPDDDEPEPTKASALPSEDNPESYPFADKENTNEDGDLILDGEAPPKRKASVRAEATYFHVVYHYVNTKRERETHDGSLYFICLMKREKNRSSFRQKGILRVCGRTAMLLNLKSGREVTTSDECKIDILEGMAVRMNKRDIDVRRDAVRSNNDKLFFFCLGWS